MSKPTLLCLDDTPEILTAYKRALKNSFNVVTARDPEQAAIHAPHVDAILSDWNLERETAEAFLNMFPNKPTVIVSARSHEVVLEHAWKILDKPCSTKEIESALLEALGM
ncbi:MAG: hypothetical protein ACWGQW_05240 [bacterium]